MTQATMSTTQEPRAAGPDQGRASFVLRSLHSLSGVLPVGVFMLLQLGAHAKALDGADAHREAMRGVSGSLGLQLAVALPLLFHAGYGIWLSSHARLNVGRYPLSGNWTYTLQRVSALLVLAFLVLYALTFWLPAQQQAMSAADVFPTLVRQLSSTWAGVPWLAFAYVVGVAACCFHLANGLSDFCVRWGLTRTRRARNVAGAIFGLLGMLAFAVGVTTIVFFATGWRLLGSGQPERATHFCAGSQTAASASATGSASAAAGASPARPAERGSK